MKIDPKLFTISFIGILLGMVLSSAFLANSPISNSITQFSQQDQHLIGYPVHHFPTVGSDIGLITSQSSAIGSGHSFDYYLYPSLFTSDQIIPLSPNSEFIEHNIPILGSSEGILFGQHYAKFDKSEEHDAIQAVWQITKSDLPQLNPDWIDFITIEVPFKLINSLGANISIKVSIEDVLSIDIGYRILINFAFQDDQIIGIMPVVLEISPSLLIINYRTMGLYVYNLFVQDNYSEKISSSTTFFLDDREEKIQIFIKNSIYREFDSYYLGDVYITGTLSLDDGDWTEKMKEEFCNDCTLIPYKGKILDIGYMRSGINGKINFFNFTEINQETPKFHLLEYRGNLTMYEPEIFTYQNHVVTLPLYEYIDHSMIYVGLDPDYPYILLADLDKSQNHKLQLEINNKQYFIPEMFDYEGNLYLTLVDAKEYWNDLSFNVTIVNLRFTSMIVKGIMSSKLNLPGQLILLISIGLGGIYVKAGWRQKNKIDSSKHQILDYPQFED